MAFVPTSLARDALLVGRVRALATLDPSPSALLALLRDRDRLEMVESVVEQLRAHMHARLGDGSPGERSGG